MSLSRTLPLLALFLGACGTATLPPAPTGRPQAPHRPAAASKPAEPKPIDALSEGRPLYAPSGFLRFCATNPGDCEGGQKRLVDWNAETSRAVMSTNTAVNRSIRRTPEALEIWSADVASGDCEDFVLTKRRALMRDGLPAEALRIAVATTAAGEMHAVLVVKTKDGDLVLDNRNESVLPPGMTDLRWIKISSAGDPRRWHTIRTS